jgi:outer membrane protein assembly factor BamA
MRTACARRVSDNGTVNFKIAPVAAGLVAGLLTAASAFAQDAQPVLERVSFAGLRGLPAPAVTQETGLKTGEPVTQAGLEAACGRLLATGLFLGCQFRFAEGTATFEVAEAPPEQDVRIDLPGVDPQDFWKWATIHAPLLKPRMPGTNDATKLYTAAVAKFAAERKLGETIESRIETTLGAHESFLVFRPANLPRITGVSFTGNASIGGDRLEEVMLKPAIGAEYTEFAFQHLLDLNVRPLYEEIGKLSVAFPKLQATESGRTVKVALTIEEGPVYRLRSANVKVDGQPAMIDGLPLDGVANWKQVKAAVDARVTQLRRDGYLDAAATVSRKLDTPAKAVDAEVAILPGQRYVFGKVILKGLSPELMERAMELWTMREGEPAMERQAAEFVDRVFKQLRIQDVVQGASIRAVARPNTNIVDYTINFR